LYHRGKTVNRKGLAFGIILVFVGAGVIPAIAQGSEKPLVPASNGEWWYVGGSGPGNYTKIQAAIDNTSDGDTVFVFNGTYVGYAIINKAINLIGEDKNTTIIIGFFAYTISIVTDWVNMSGFTIQNGGRLGEGVRIDSSDNHFINNIIHTPGDRIRLSGCNNTISGNTFEGTYIFLSGDNNTISGNSITNNYYGIYLIDSYDNIIANNSFFNSGLFISDDIFGDNIVRNNTVNGKPLVYIDNESDMVFDADAGQIVLAYCTNISVQNQEIFNTTVGIQIWESNTCVISGSTIAGNHYGICLYGWNNTIHDNIVINNHDAIRLSGDYNTISGNSVSNNLSGISLNCSSGNTISGNSISKNRQGIYIVSSINNTILKTIF